MSRAALTSQTLPLRLSDGINTSFLSCLHLHAHQHGRPTLLYSILVSSGMALMSTITLSKGQSWYTPAPVLPAITLNSPSWSAYCSNTQNSSCSDLGTRYSLPQDLVGVGSAVASAFSCKTRRELVKGQKGRRWSLKGGVKSTKKVVAKNGVGLGAGIISDQPGLAGNKEHIISISCHYHIHRHYLKCSE